MLFAKVSVDVSAIAVVSKYVVVVDWLFTATTAVLQPLTDFYMIYLAGYPLHSKWIILYVIAGACWLPVVWLQIRMRDLAAVAARDDTACGAVLGVFSDLGNVERARVCRVYCDFLANGGQADVAG